MNIGIISIYLAFFAAVAAAMQFVREGGKPKMKSLLAPRLYMGMVGLLVVASVVLLALLLSHQFQYSYVAHYSSLNLPFAYLISAFWAGQEGTFLLWALMVAIMGIYFLRRSQGNDPYAMAVVCGYAAFLLLLMIVKSPFETTADVPPDGAGMNPLLQDPWMVIHPPILFLGYAATVFPFALVVSGLARRNYDRWYALGFRWTLFASVSLGAGIIIGGFWAYEVLGWGGYWGWDPVENSSLVPWLILLALTHGLVVQKAKGSLLRFNMFLSLLAFLLVLYATFLTRSGVLADFSVHSFVNLGINNYLVGVIVLAGLVGYGLFATRFSSIKAPKVEISSVNRELTLLLSMFALCLAALFTFVGMSSPILTGLVGKASQVDTPFYNKVNLPVAIAMSLLLGITPFLGWTEERKSAFIKRLSMPLVLTALSVVISYVAGVMEPLLLVFIAAASFGLISNVIISFRQYRSGWVQLGGPISHIGVALLLIGIIGSGKFDDSTKLALRLGEPQSAYGYKFTFKGVTEQGNIKPHINIEVSDGKTSYLAKPKLYFSEYNQSNLREPDIKIYPLKDLYISPIELHANTQTSDRPQYELAKGETKNIGGYQVSFVRFDMGGEHQSSGMSVGAVLNVVAGAGVHEVIPRLLFDQNGQRRTLPVEMPPAVSSGEGMGRPRIVLNAINVEEKKVLLELSSPDGQFASAGTQELLVDVSTKPLMMVVWTGVVLIIAGTAIAFRRRMLPNE